MPPKKAKKQKPFEKLYDFYEDYKKNCEAYGVEELPAVKAIYDEAIAKKSKKQPVMIQIADEEAAPNQIRSLVETYQQSKEIRIKILAFYNTNSGDEGLHMVAHALTPPLELVGLAYHSNNVGPSGCRALGRFLIQSKSLCILELDYNQGIGDDGVCGLTHYGHCETLTRLSLNFCGISDKGSEFLSRWIGKPQCKVTELLLKGNRIGPLGAISFGANLPDNNSLERLDLSDNLFGYDEECLNALHDGIRDCKTLTAVSLLNNYECPEGIAEKFLQLVTDKPLGEFELTVKMDCCTFQNTKAISLANAKKIAKEAKRKKKEGDDGEEKKEEDAAKPEDGGAQKTEESSK